MFCFCVKSLSYDQGMSIPYVTIAITRGATSRAERQERQPQASKDSKTQNNFEKINKLWLHLNLHRWRVTLVVAHTQTTITYERLWAHVIMMYIHMVMDEHKCYLLLFHLHPRETCILQEHMASVTNIQNQISDGNGWTHAIMAMSITMST